MTIRITLALLAATLFVSAHSLAQGTARDEPAGPLVVVGGLHRDMVLRLGDSTGLLAVWDGNAVVAGTADAVLVVRGKVRLLPSARVGRVFVAGGAAELENGSVITGDLHLLDATLTRAPGATVRGEVLHRQWSRIARGLRTFGVLIGIGISLAVLLGAVIAVAVAPVGMRRAGDTLQREIALSLVCAGVLWLLMPWLALELAATIVGLPIGLGYWIFVLPTLGFIGYLVSAVSIGEALTRRVRGNTEPPRPYLTAFVGVAVLLAVGLVPVVGAPVNALAAIVGSGAVVLAAGRPVERRAGLKGVSQRPRHAAVTTSGA